MSTIVIEPTAPRPEPAAPRPEPTAPHPQPAATHPEPAAFVHALRREPLLAGYALLLFAAMLPALVALGLDERTVRGVAVWVKPLKFMASIGLFAATTAWLLGVLPDAVRRGAWVRGSVWTIVVAGTLELGYIAWQAAHGQASHYNLDDGLRAALYGAMGAVAVAMTATQAVLATVVARHARPGVDPLWREAVVVALAATFVLGAGAGILLGSFQPPAGTGVPVLGWHLGGGDLRPAHFVGMHAQQAVPLVALALMRWAPPPARRPLLRAFVVALAALWAAAMLIGLDGATSLDVPGAIRRG